MNPDRRQIRKSWQVLGAVVTATIGIASCDTTVSVGLNQLSWGFVTLNAVEVSGEARVAPTAFFFKGEVSTIPNAALKPDSCFPAVRYVPPTNSFQGVTYLDAGASVTARVGQTTHSLQRQSTGGVTTYTLGSGTTIAYGGGDSVIVNIPGATGGYPTQEIRAKTADRFTLQPVNIVNQRPLQLRWTPSTDTNSVMIFNLIYTPPGGVAQDIRCAYRDDGIDSIPFAAHQLWASDANTRRDLVATRLRTTLRGGGNLALMFISTYGQPLTKQ
jgi:hypothetical protein